MLRCFPRSICRIFFNSNTKNGYIDIRFTKHLDWRYEDEYRICVNGGDRLVELPGEVVEINFGCKMPEGSKRTIANIVKGLPESDNIELYSAVKADYLNLKFEKYH